MKIGDKIWHFDENRRRYGTGSGPIYREHWVEYVIVYETRISWLVGLNEKFPPSSCTKISKKDLAAGKLIGWVTSREEVERRCWIHENRWRLSEKVQRCLDYKALQKIATIVGYEPVKS